MNIEVLSLTKKYGQALAVDNVSFQVTRGEIVGYLGPNGAGKSTTVKMLTGILAPTSGRILIDGLDVVENSLSIKQRIGYVPESGGLYESLPVLFRSVSFDYSEQIGRMMSSSAKRADTARSPRTTGSLPRWFNRFLLSNVGHLNNRPYSSRKCFQEE